MSIRHYYATAIDCDGADCDEAFYDAVPMSEASARYLAKYHGWTETPEGEHYCPACTARRSAPPKGDAA